MDMKTLYKVKGIGSEQTIDSKGKAQSDDTGKITRAEDRWNDKLPDGAFANVSVLSLRSWLYFGQSWAYWLWSFTWETWWWRVSYHHSHLRGMLSRQAPFPRELLADPNL
jgi:hypothetical protein